MFTAMGFDTEHGVGWDKEAAKLAFIALNYVPQHVL